jgi:AraC-like DNA-binding protein
VPEFRIRSPPVLSRRRAPKNAVRRPPELLNSFHMPAIKLPLGITTGLKTLGVDPTELLRRSGLPLTLFSSEQIAVTTEQVFALWQTLGELTSDPAIGLKLADQVPVAQHHPASIAAHHARNFRDGLQRMARYKLLCCSEEMRMTERAGECVLEFSWLLSRERVPPLLLDAAFASMLQLGRRGTGVKIWPLRVELRQPPEYREIRERYFGCPIKFKACRNAIVFRATDLDRPFITYNAELVAMLSPQIDRELARTKSEVNITGRVKWVLMRLLGGRPPVIRDVARELGLSCRTLQRRITEERTTFRRLIGDARRELARHYLLQPALELGEVACLLGYEDPNSFFRAFRDWEGATPTEWRIARQVTHQIGQQPH